MHNVLHLTHIRIVTIELIKKKNVYIYMNILLLLIYYYFIFLFYFNGLRIMNVLLPENFSICRFDDSL